MCRQQGHPFVRGLAIAAVAGLLASSIPAMSASLEEIQGAWGVNEVPCDEVFKTQNGRMSLATSFGQSGGGFIVNGKQVQTPTATCRMLSSREKGDLFTFVLDCESQIVFETTQVSVRLLDPNTLVRTHAEFPEMDVKYRRCK